MSAIDEQPPTQEPVPTRLVVIGYVLALICALLPLAILGAAFAGAAIFQRGRRAQGAGVIVLAIVCVTIAVLTRS
ncbi:MAG: hypothetical protein QOI73_3109 [Solirubrobacteraceae bacterium]|nr:hypothetical protein [Solirubrobacteraceae bacterium]